jgi:hypothetical protein
MLIHVGGHGGYYVGGDGPGGKEVTATNCQTVSERECQFQMLFQLLCWLQLYGNLPISR